MRTASSGRPVADADLVLRARMGDTAAFGELWRRHHTAGVLAARAIARGEDAEQLVQEAFTRIHRAIRRGAGPNGSFRAHLLAGVRNTADADAHPRAEGATTVDSAEGAEARDGEGIAAAFRMLSHRWQEVLWYTRVEPLMPTAAAPLLGVRPGAVAQLDAQAWDALRETWLRTRSADAPASALAPDRLTSILLPLVLGCSGAARYRSATSSASAAAPLAVPPMPKSVIAQPDAHTGPLTGPLSTLTGTVPVVTGPVALRTGPVALVAADGAGPAAQQPMGASAEGTAMAASAHLARTGEAPSTGGGRARRISGIGALVGAGSAALVVAGALAASAVVPGMLSASDAGPRAGASAAGPRVLEPASSAIASEVTPDESMAVERPMVFEMIDERRPVPPSPPASRHAERHPERHRSGVIVPPRVPAPAPSRPADTAHPVQTAPAPRPTPESSPRPESTPTPSPAPTPTPTPSPSPAPVPPADESQDPAADAPILAPGAEGPSGSESSPTADSAPSSSADSTAADASRQADSHSE
ncbi:RNA polymerase sigma factor [Microbacterium sp. USHLN186]|uniref:RNA polymerase sigma factor n=1 Tax=Microbacterium sp. USHLN186 TaxID=3081286 RepID=UPI0030176689